MKRIYVGVVAALGLFAFACGSSGGGQSTECKDYVKCYEATGGTKGSLDSSYGAMGTCWTTTATGDSCTAACKSAAAALKASYPDAGC